MVDSEEVVDIDVCTTWESLNSNHTAVLVDVRTEAEWSQVGIPEWGELNQNFFLISWQFAPDMRVNEHFVDELREAGVAKGVPVYFLCRSGVRSRAAAECATSAGYGPCYNVAEGFEGVANIFGRRCGGWRGNGLPETKLSKF
jgi:rhodanese-related sulfurtransferase